MKLKLKPSPTQPIFASAHHYFDHLVETMNYPTFYRHFEEDFTEVDGIKIHLEVINTHPEAPTLVFIPGTAIYGLCYSELLSKIAGKGFNVVTFDPRGHGQSGGTRGDYTVAEIMRDAEQVVTYAIKRFNPEVSLMGSSQGGIVAFYLAAKDDRLRSVICQNIADLSAPEAVQLSKNPLLFRYIRRVLTKRGHLLPKLQIPISAHINLDKMPVKHFGTARKFMEMDPYCLKSISLRALKSLAHSPMPKPVEQINTPILVMQGTADHIFPVTYIQTLFNKLNGEKKLRLFEGRSHGLVHEEPEGVAEETATWMRQFAKIGSKSH
jgi:pimeloyl-ACP methyl ester carboxylesterase